jgi:hypothetical protein
MVYSRSNHSVLLRVLEDRRSHDFKAYVFPVTPMLRGNVRLSFADEGGRVASAVIDVHGCTVVNVPSGFNWKASYVGVVTYRQR